jgi:LuxR family maltose regulon positive regulatory protein
VTDLDAVVLSPARPSTPTGPIAQVLRHAPRLASLLVDRPRLTGLLDQRPPLTVLRAPVGFGKTTLLAQWVTEQVCGTTPAAETVAWLRVRADAGDAETFWTDLLQVLEDAGLAVPPWTDSTDPARLAHQAERALIGAERPVLLVIDDLDHVMDRTAETAVLDLVRHLRGLRLAVCVRNGQRFEPYRYLDIDTLELTAKDLRFTIDEVARLIELAGVSMQAELVEQAHRECAGWPEPARALALQLRDRVDVPAALVPGLVARVVTDFLRNRLLGDPLRPDLVHLALRTSLPDVFDLELAELLAGGTPTAAQVDTLVADGYLVSEEHDGRPFYRWPTAARDALRVELARVHPELVPELHARLGRWHLAHKSAGLAVRHAVASRDWPLVIEVIESTWRTLYYERGELAAAFLALPVEEVTRSPRALALRDSNVPVPDDRLLRVPMLPEDDGALGLLGRSEKAAETLDTCLAVVVALRRRGAFALARAYGQRALLVARSACQVHTGEVLALAAVLNLHVGITQLLADDTPAALTTLGEAFARGRSHPKGHVENGAAGKLALAHALLGDTDSARSWLRLHHQTPMLSDSWISPLVASTGLAAELLLALDDLDLGQADSAKVQILEHVGGDEFWAFLVYARAQLALHTGTGADLLNSIDGLRRSNHQRLTEPSISGPLTSAAEADLLLALGRGNLAAAVLNGPDSGHPLLRVGRARFALLSGHPKRALVLSDGAAWERHIGRRERLTMLTIRAVASERTGDHAAALATMEHVVAALSSTATWRPLLTVPREDLARLLLEVPGGDALLAGPLSEHRSLFPDEISAVELTGREQQILENLAHGLSVPEIARQSVLSYNTVRTQQRTLYKKLGTSDRAQAIARARQWGLLPAGSHEDRHVAGRRP